MSGIKAKFTKNTAGDTNLACQSETRPLFGGSAYRGLSNSLDALYDGLPLDGNANSYNVELSCKKAMREGDYTNFENPVYELDANGQPNFESASRPSKGSTVFDGLFTKGDNRKRWIIIGSLTAVALLAIIIVAAALGSNAAKEKIKKEEKLIAAESKGSASYYGSMRITELQWSDAYNDPTNDKYIRLKAQFEVTMGKAITSEGMGEKYVETEVLKFSSGSVVATYMVVFTSPPASSPADLNNAIVDFVKKNDGMFGSMAVDVESLTMFDELPASSGLETTTVGKADKTSPTAAVVTSSSGSKTPASVESCGHRIVEECRHVLPYRNSIRPLAEQRRMKNRLLRLANHTVGCYPQSKFYMCSIIAPHCTVHSLNSADGPIKAFVLPCEHLCQDYRFQCKEELIEVDTSGILECHAFLPYSPETEGKCLYHGDPPTTQAVTPPSDKGPYSELCYPIHHSYCSNIPWRAAYLPNFLGHTTLRQAYDFLSFMQALQDSGMHCHEELHTLVCGTLLPECGSDYHRVPPCKSLCRDVLANCTLMLSNLPVPIPLSCSMFHQDENCTNVGDRVITAGCDNSTEYTCLDGQQCINLDQRCNGSPDCVDGSDERGCANTTACLEGQFRCTITGGCIPDNWRCDSYNDCGDGTDEADCQCGADQFQCSASDGTLRCINASQECDGYYNCFNRQDEANCANFTCREDQFTCSNGLCRPQRFVCDGDDDCGDLSDEHDCLRDEVCLESEFKCVNGSRHWGIGHTSCVPKSWKCDTERDCSDGSDEKHCPSYCHPNPCSHGGNCTADIRGYLCECPAGTGGSNCQIVEELPEVHCDTPIVIDACKAPLRPFHSTTIATTFYQNELNPHLTAAINRFDGCYEHATEFLCQYATPQCGSQTFPVFPCKSMCREFLAQCASSLNESEPIDRLIDCNRLPDDELYPEAECFKLDHTTTTIAPPSATPELGCEPLKIDYCSFMGFNTTYLPNYFNHTHQATAVWLLEQFEYAHSSMPTCNPYLKHFGCAISVPPCNEEGTGPIPPCRELCEAVAYDCGYWMDHMRWRFPFTCATFPSASNSSATCIGLPEPVKKEGCYGDQFECGSGECVHKTFQCDSFPDCDDGSDEEAGMCATFWSSFSSTTPFPDYFGTTHFLH